MEEKKKEEKKSLLSPLWNHFTKKIVAGLVLVVPLGLTIFILKFVFEATDNLLIPVVEKYYGKSIPGIGFILMIILLYVLGVFSTNLLGRKIINFMNRLLSKTPVVKTVYNTVKQVVDTLSGPQNKAFQKVVVVSLLGSDLKVLGFVTGSSMDRDGAKYVHVFIPTSPNPTSGYLQLLRPEQILETKLSVEEAVKIILSGGVTSPEKIE